jgi:hypothetical protein
LQRFPVRAESHLDLVTHNQRVIRQIHASKNRSGIVIDVRDGPPPTDDGVDESMRPLRETTYLCYTRVAVLLRTQAGILQLNRIGYPPNTRVLTTLDESEAFPFARGTQP